MYVSIRSVSTINLLINIHTQAKQQHIDTLRHAVESAQRYCVERSSGSIDTACYQTDLENTIETVLGFLDECEITDTCEDGTETADIDHIVLEECCAGGSSAH
jgi:hypothetical protein